MALPRSDHHPDRGLRAPGPHRRAPPDHGRQPAAELPAPRPGRLHVPPRPAALLEPVHLQRHTADGRLQRWGLLPPHGPLRGPAGPCRLARHRGRSLLGRRRRDVRLPSGPGPFDCGLRSGRGHVRLRRACAQPGEPRGHDRGLRRHPVAAVVGPAHRPRRAVALVHRLRDRLRNGDPGRRARGDARRGVARRRVCRHVGRPERSTLVASPLEGRRRHGACPVTGGHPVVAGSRGHSRLAAGERRACGGRELSHTVQHPRPGPLPRRRVRAPRRGAILQPVQPARGRHLPGRAAAHRLDHPGASAVAEPAPPRASGSRGTPSASSASSSPSARTHRWSTCSTACRSTATSACRAAT